jgi:hypothetical protein
MQRMRRFARFWDLVGNSGNFVKTTPLLWAGGASPFESFLGFSDWIYGQIQRTHTIALETIARQLWTYLVERRGCSISEVAEALAQDWRRSGRKDLPPWLDEHQRPVIAGETAGRPAMPRRQAKHVGAS